MPASRDLVNPPNMVRISHARISPAGAIWVQHFRHDSKSARIKKLRDTAVNVSLLAHPEKGHCEGSGMDVLLCRGFPFWGWETQSLDILWWGIVDGGPVNVMGTRFTCANMKVRGHRICASSWHRIRAAFA